MKNVISLFKKNIDNKLVLIALASSAIIFQAIGMFTGGLSIAPIIYQVLAAICVSLLIVFSKSLYSSRIYLIAIIFSVPTITFLTILSVGITGAISSTSLSPIYKALETSLLPTMVISIVMIVSFTPAILLPLLLKKYRTE